MATKMVRNDISHVATWQLKEILEQHVNTLRESAVKMGADWSLEEWALSNSLDWKQISRVMRLETQTSGLSVVDKICCAIGGPQYLHSLTFIPGSYKNDPIKMAREEYLAEFDEDPPQDFLVRRAAELAELRERMLSISVAQDL